MNKQINQSAEKLSEMRLPDDMFVGYLAQYTCSVFSKCLSYEGKPEQQWQPSAAAQSSSNGLFTWSKVGPGRRPP